MPVPVAADRARRRRRLFTDNFRFRDWMPSFFIVIGRLTWNHRHRMDEYLDSLLASQTAQRALPPTIDKNRNRKTHQLINCFYHLLHLNVMCK